MHRRSAPVRALLAASASVIALAALAAGGVARAEAEADEGHAIEELVVTAEKREQLLKDVPVAISAFTANRRELIGLGNAQDYVNWTPGANFSGTDRISLRGAGRNTFYIGNDPGVAAYTDGFYSASSSELYKSSLFVERTEFLRGPQGTLYGRNAIGGAINVISKRPDKEYSSELRAGYANYDRLTVEGRVSLPVAPSLRFSFGASYDDQSKGYISNIGTANDAATIKRTYYEAQVEAELGENTTAWMRYGRTTWDDTTGIGDRLSNTLTPYETTRPFSPSGGLLTNGSLGYTIANPGVTDPYVMNTNRDGYANLRGNHLLTAQVAHDLGFAELKWIGGFQQYNYQTGGDNDSTSRTTPVAVGPIALFLDYTVDFNEKRKYFSNEINLTSKGDGPMSWILGAYQYHEEASQTNKFGAPSQPQIAAPVYILSLSPLITMAAPANPSRDYVSQLATLDGDAWAVFGQGRYAFNDQFAVTAGARYTKDKKDGFESQRLIMFSPFSPLGVANGIVAVDVSSDLDGNPLNGVQNFRSMSNSWDAVSGTLNIDWTPNRDTLVYAKYSRGYKSGGFLLGTIAAKPEAKKETVDAYEVGLKATIGTQLQVNAAAFYNDYDDLQINLQQQNVARTAAANNFVNVGARAYGLEVEAIWEPVENLQLIAMYGYLDTKITEGCCFYDPADPSGVLPGARPSGGVSYTGSAANGYIQLRYQDLAGSPLYQSPKNKFAFNANYTFQTELGNLILSGTYVWTDKVIYQPFDNPAFESPSFGTADFRAIWNDIQDRYTFIAFVKNAFKEEGFTSAGSANPGAVYGLPAATFACGSPSGRCLVQSGVSGARGLIAPRTYGMELQYRF